VKDLPDQIPFRFKLRCSPLILIGPLAKAYRISEASVWRVIKEAEPLYPRGSSAAASADADTKHLRPPEIAA
jgi:hypothetical protein